MFACSKTNQKGQPITRRFTAGPAFGGLPCAARISREFKNSLRSNNLNSISGKFSAARLREMAF
jgi:hypothetical protein